MRRVVGAVALIALLSGCMGDPEPIEPTTSPTPTVTVTPPEMPEQAKEESSEGATAFLQHYIAVLNYASATGDVEEFKRLSHPDCSGCDKYRDAFLEMYAAGGWMKGGEWTFTETRVRTRGSEVFVTTTMDLARSHYKETRDAEERASQPSQDVLTFALVRDEGAWKVTQFVRGDLP